MNNIFSIFLVSSIALISFACGKSNHEVVHPGGGQSWRLSLSLPEGLQLNDDSSMLLDPLRAQLNRINLGRTFFRDPALSTGNLPFTAARLEVFGQYSLASLTWKNPQFSGGTWKFGSCGDSGAGTACEYQSLLTCLQTQAREDASITNSLGATGSSPSRSLLLEWFRRCGVSSAFGSDVQSQATFSLRNNKLYFEPSPLLSLLIYPGAWSGYEDAVVQSAPVASIPAQVPCPRGDGACLESPIPVNSCSGCEALQQGKLYTVFFVEALRQDYAAIKSVVYVP
ncbi:hypothetical protein EBR21_05860 [bacterium]|nr:hypothetical protein [bacterium]